jgi:hypothetical protein
MRKDDFSKHLERRQRIRKTTLVVGMDIGCEFNAVGMMNKDGKILGKYPKIYNSRLGFNYFTNVIEKTKSRNGLHNVLIGMEPMRVRLKIFLFL